MPILNILHFPDPRLRTKTFAVEVVDDEIRSLIDDMLETMYNAPGMGLAAPQVNAFKRLIIIDISKELDAPLSLINPQITAREGKVQMEEGCLSVPGIYETIERSQRIKVEALDRDGNPFVCEAEDLLAVCIQHEIDHLDGKLFVDYLSEMKRSRIQKKMEKLRRKTL